MSPSSDRPRVTLITDNFPPVGGGVSRYYAGLSGAYGRRMEVISPGVDVGRGPFPSASDRFGRLRQAIAVSRLTSNLRGTVIFGHPHLAALSRLPPSGRHGIVIHGGEWSDHPGGAAAVRCLLNRMDFVVVNSRATAQTWLEGLDPNMLVLHPALPQHVVERGSRQASGDDGSDRPLRLLTVSRLVPRKRVAETAEAVRSLISSGVRLEYRIVGSGPQAVELERLRSAGITVHNDVDDEQLWDHYAWADVFVLCPTQLAGGEGFEGFGIVYLEAAAFGLPVIATDTGGIREAVAPGGHWLLPPDAWSTLTRLLVRLSDDDRGVLPSMRRAAHTWAAANVWDNRADALARFVREQAE